VIDRIKKIIELVDSSRHRGVLYVTPRWFRPSPYLEPDIEYAAAFVAFVTFSDVGLPREVWRPC